MSKYLNDGEELEDHIIEDLFHTLADGDLSVTEISRDKVAKMLKPNVQTIRQKVVTDVVEIEPLGPVAQFTLFMKRNISQVDAVQFVGSTLAMWVVAFFQAMAHQAKSTVSTHLIFHQKNSMESISVCTTMVAILTTRYFCLEQIIFRREMATGVNVTAYWLSKQLIAFVTENVWNTFAYFVMYYCLVCPLTTFGDYFWLYFMSGWFGSGFGLLLGQYLEINQAVIFAFIFPLLLGTFYGGAQPNLANMQDWQKAISLFSFSRWPTESAALYENKQFPEYLQNQVGFPYLDNIEYDRDPHMRTFWWLFSVGLGLRLISFLMIHWQAAQMTEWVKHELPGKLRKFVNRLFSETKGASMVVDPDIEAIEMWGDDFMEYDDEETEWPNLFGEIETHDRDNDRGGVQELWDALETDNAHGGVKKLFGDDDDEDEIEHRRKTTAEIDIEAQIEKLKQELVHIREGHHEPEPVHEEEPHFEPKHQQSVSQTFEPSLQRAISVPPTPKTPNPPPSTDHALTNTAPQRRMPESVSHPPQSGLKAKPKRSENIEMTEPPKKKKKKKDKKAKHDYPHDDREYYHPEEHDDTRRKKKKKKKKERRYSDSYEEHEYYSEGEYSDYGDREPSYTPPRKKKKKKKKKKKYRHEEPEYGYPPYGGREHANTYQGPPGPYRGPTGPYGPPPQPHSYHGRPGGFGPPQPYPYAQPFPNSFSRRPEQKQENV